MSERIYLPVEEYTTPNALQIHPNTDAISIRNMMKERGIRHLLVAERNDILGIISDRDLHFLDFVNQKEEILNLDIKASDIMESEPYIVEAKTPLEKVALYMSANKIGSAIVQYPEEESFGIFTSTDALNALTEIIRGEA